jgi:hypothetical protein
MAGWTFLNPLFLWGLALGAVPILLHLLQRRRYQVRRWAAMAFLQTSTRNTARRLRIEQLLLLAVRVLILMLAALALSRPVVPPAAGGAFSLLSGQARVHATILIDDSYSMGASGGAAGGGGTRWSRAKARALELIRQGLRPGDSLSVILAGDPPRALIRRPTFDLEEGARRIETASLRDGGTDFARAARLCLETLKDSPHPNREVYLVTDNQAVGWSGAAPRLWMEISRLARLHLVLVGEGAPGNVAVTDAGVPEGLVSTRRPAVIEARIVNHDDRPRNGLLATLVVNGRAGASTRVDLPPRGEARARFTHLFTTPGVHAGSVRLSPDSLPRDDEAFFRVQAREQLHVLCLNGRPSSEPQRDAAFYLVHALSPGDAGSSSPDSFIRTTVAAGALTADRLRGADVVVLADVSSLSALDARALTDFLKAGGGALVFLGDGAREREGRGTVALGRGFTAIGMNLPELLGLRLTRPEEPRTAAAQQPLALDPSSLDHPILARFRNAGDVDLTTASFARRAPLPMAEGDQQARVMARFSDGAPAWVETRVGRGRAIVVAHTAGVDGSTLPYKPAFVLLVHQAVSYLSQDPDAGRRLTVGDRLVKILEPAANGPRPGTSFSLLDPEGRRTTLTASVLGEGRTPSVRYDRTDRAGLYRLSAAGESAGAAPVEVFAVNLPRREGDLRPMSRAALAALMPEARFYWIDPNQPLSTALRQARLGLELWRPLVIAVLLLMLLESFLAQRFGRQGGSRPAAPDSLPWAGAEAGTAEEGPTAERAEVQTVGAGSREPGAGSG